MEKSRSWMVTIHEKNMRNAGLTDNDIADPTKVAEFFKDRWEKSAQDRVACVAACKSKSGLFHLHAYLYGNATTQNAVASCMYDSHVEPVISKNALSSYIPKVGKYAEKGETVIYISGEENIKSEQGHRSDLEYMQSLIDQGLSPDEVMGQGLQYYRYKDSLIEYFQYKQRKAAPLKKQMHRVWHVGSAGSGIEDVIDTLCNKHGKDNVFILQSMESGCFDLYNQLGSPPVVVLDDLDDSIKLRDLLGLLGEYTNTTAHARYRDAIPLWEHVHILSTLPPEKYCDQVRGANGFERLKTRLDYISYHYNEEGQKKTLVRPAADYEGIVSLKEDVKNKNRDL